MREYCYDFHVHSCLSPCGDRDMTPNNLVQMALLSGCEILGITDHNSCKNAPAVCRVGEREGLLVLPGMELCVAEEAHVVCLFDSLEGAMAFDAYVEKNMPSIKNKPEIFGEQWILDEQDEPVALEENLLLVSSFLTVNEVRQVVESYGGTAFPAHIDRDSYSVLASLGDIPPEAGFTTAELSAGCDPGAFLLAHPQLGGLRLLRDSDSHYLDGLSTEENHLLLPEKSRKAVVELLRSAK